jgi:hypothetical protein
MDLDISTQFLQGLLSLRMATVSFRKQLSVKIINTRFIYVIYNNSDTYSYGDWQMVLGHFQSLAYGIHYSTKAQSFINMKNRTETNF